MVEPAREGIGLYQELNENAAGAEWLLRRLCCRSTFHTSSEEALKPGVIIVVGSVDRHYKVITTATRSIGANNTVPVVSSFSSSLIASYSYCTLHRTCR